ncbi:hypothetical protein HGQ99_11430, partial [Neisseria gonorrhoeae]|nr:hypothetical protein [Neisseria gonorrhoeae]
MNKRKIIEKKGKKTEEAVGITESEIDIRRINTEKRKKEKKKKGKAGKKKEEKK